MADLNEREPELGVRHAERVRRLALVRRDPGAVLWSVLALPLYEGDASSSQGLYFVNTSTETLTAVRAAAGGLFRVDDEGVYQSTGGAKKEFLDVRPQEGVRVDSWHPMADGDFILQCELEVIGPQGAQGFRLSGRGAFRSDALYFDDGVLRRALGAQRTQGAAR